MFRLLLAALSAPLLAFAAPTALEKRTAGRATYYQVGLGACGQYNVPSDFIVALNQAQFETGGYPSSQCFRGITITYNGRSTHATVMDECPSGGCNYGDLDMSEGLFTFFEPTSTGVFYMTWEFDGEGSAPQPQPQPQPQTTTQQQWQPATSSTPQYTPPAPSTSTSVYVAPPSSSATSSQQMVSDQAYDPSSSSTPEPNPNAWSGGVVDGANKVALQFANLMFAAGGQ